MPENCSVIGVSIDCFESGIAVCEEDASVNCNRPVRGRDKRVDVHLFYFTEIGTESGESNKYFFDRTPVGRALTSGRMRNEDNVAPIAVWLASDDAGPGGLVAHCRLGRGTATVIADAPGLRWIARYPQVSAALHPRLAEHGAEGGRDVQVVVKGGLERRPGAIEDPVATSLFGKTEPFVRAMD